MTMLQPSLDVACPICVEVEAACDGTALVRNADEPLSKQGRDRAGRAKIAQRPAWRAWVAGCAGTSRATRSAHSRSKRSARDTHSLQKVTEPLQVALHARLRRRRPYTACRCIAQSRLCSPPLSVDATSDRQA